MLTLLIPDALVPIRASGAPTDAPARGAPVATGLPPGARLLGGQKMSASGLRQTPWEAWLAGQFGLGADWPVAAWSRFDSATGKAAILTNPSRPWTAVPAHLQAALDHLVLHPPSLLGLALTEAQALADSANDHFRDDGLQLEVLTPGQWLVSIATPMDVQFASSHVATGRRLDQYMPAGPDARRLRALLNEMQMLWHEHPVNEDRRDRGALPVNALWVEGTAGPTGPSPFVTVFSDQPVTRGLARAGGLAPESVHSVAQTTEGDVQTLRTSVALAASRGPTLLELPSGTDPNQLGQWLSSPLLPRPIEIVLTGDLQWQHWQLAPVPWWRFWQRPARR